MTFKELSVNFMINNGMFPSDAETVFTNIRSQEANESMRDRWNEDVDDYPPVMKSLMVLSTKRTAYEWIEEHQPLAWNKQ